MRRLARRLFTLFSAVSLGVMVIVAAGWAYSHRASMSAEWARESRVPGRTHQYGITVARGSVVATFTQSDLHPQFIVPTEGNVMTPLPDPGFAGRRSGPRSPINLADRSFGEHWWTSWGFGFAREAIGLNWGTLRLHTLVIPAWSLLMASSVLPMTWVARRRSLKRQTVAGLCPSCGYDLRASPDRCPECGTAAVISN